MWMKTIGTITGPNHLRNNTPNQDAVGVREVGDYVAVVVADGAGSLSESHIGAHKAVNVVLDEIEISNKDEHDLDLVLELAVECARETLLNMPNYEQKGCTVAAALVGRDRWAVTTVGDSFVVMEKEDGEYELFTSPPAGEYVNITKLLTSPSFQINRFSGTGNIKSFAVASDGLAHISIKDNKPFVPFWSFVFNNARPKEIDNVDVDSNNIDNNIDNTLDDSASKLLDHLLSENRLDDDTTLAVLVQSPENIVEEVSLPNTIESSNETSDKTEPGAPENVESSVDSVE